MLHRFNREIVNTVRAVLELGIPFRQAAPVDVSAGLPNPTTTSIAPCANVPNAFWGEVDGGQAIAKAAVGLML
jgi:hypothetical protein